MNNYFELIADEFSITSKQVEATIRLLNDGATIPFISRYRKEVTGSLDEVIITNIRNRAKQLQEIDKRRESIIASINEQGKLTDELKQKITEATTISELEDIYLPYRSKRKTRASIAKAKGLDPLAKLLMSQDNFDVEQKASGFIDAKKEIKTVEEALAGARDIIAEWINENLKVRTEIRQLYIDEAVISSKIAKGKEEEGVKYKTYFDYEEPLIKAPSHRILAMFRGENESFLKIKICPTEDKAVKIIERQFVKADNEASKQIQIAVVDSYKRLLAPSIETEIRQMAKQQADESAIIIFATNLRQLLLAPPLGQKNVLAIDPGFKTGCKIVCLSKQGNILHNETIYPHPPHNQMKQAINKIESLVSAYNIEAIAIGNGTAGRETEYMIKKIRFTKDVMAVMVNESGASVYSASSVAREEFPEYDVTVRGAISIGRRLMDPLAELVKIDPKSIGVGQYQHDVEQTALQKSLEDVVISCVNSVGVEVNTASKQLLMYVSGVGASLADSIINYRDENGPFKSRKDLMKVSRFGKKVFEQAAGFIRIRDAENPLDRTAVHPESYTVVEKITKKLSCSVEDLIAKTELRRKINLNDYVTSTVGLPTLNDIMAELEKPGRDPRQEIEMFTFDRSINTINDLIVGKRYLGIVTNITAFGAFVDVGVHQDGLVHISQLSDEFVRDANNVVKLNQQVIVRVIDVDVARKRIAFSMKKSEKDKVS